LPVVELVLDVMRHQHAGTERLGLVAACDQRDGSVGELRDLLVYNTAHIEIGIEVGTIRVVTVEDVLKQSHSRLVSLEGARIEEQEQDALLSRAYEFASIREVLR